MNVRFDGDKLDIDIYIIVEYGTRIASVASSVANTGRYHVENRWPGKFTSVNVHAGLRISNPD